MNTPKRILCLFVLALGLALGASQAGAATVTVTVGGTTYTLTASNLTGAADAALMQAQPWWGNPALASAISGALQYQLGDLNGGPGGVPPGIPAALLAYGFSPPYVSIQFWNGTTVVNCSAGCPLQTDSQFYVTSVTTRSSIPALSEWGLILLAALIGLLGIHTARRRRMT